ncbi:MAG: hypothetical protein EPO02_13000 [Nitrospirae bacterium]|nr:MAG: hypothetical protein EPO02_13000 [Nitrospirota bacterium]
MSTESVKKLQPNRTMHLRGFDDRGSAAALHATTASSFKVSGVFRDAADFAVLMLWDRDCFFEHQRMKYLPDDLFDGITLEFDAHYAGLQPLDSIKFPTIAWPYLSYIATTGDPGTVLLFDYAGASPVSGTYTKAQTTVTVAASPAIIYDRVTIWFRNYAFDVIAAGGETASDVAATLVSQINGAGMDDSGIEAEQSGADVIIRAKRPGRDGNLLRIYCQSKTATLTVTPSAEQLAGGSSDATWHYTIPLDGIGIPLTDGETRIRQLWLTFAPELADAAPYADTEFVATFTNWSVSGSNAALKVAGPGSVRIGSRDAWCQYTGSSWVEEASNQPGGTGWYWKGFARRASTVGDKVTIEYHAQATHDLYVGTSLYTDRGKWGVRLDGDTQTSLNCYLATDVPIVTRRQVRSAVAAGAHTVTLTLRAHDSPSSNDYAYFDFLEAAVPGDVPDAPATYSTVSPAVDYDTDHAYKVSPQRMMWAFDRLGFEGPMNLYVGVFWWNQRVRDGAVFPAATIDFSQTTYATGDGVFVDISGQTFGKSVFPADDDVSIAKHFAQFINGASTGVWAESSGAVLTITNRAIGSAYNFTLTAWKETPTHVDLTVSGSLSGGTYGIWIVDPTQTPTINRGAREWLADLLAECATRSREIVLAYSMELLNPPDDPGDGQVWAARLHDGTAVTTATGFGSNVTTHCAFLSKVLDYQKDVFLDTAGLMDAAGVPVHLQAGEFVWWYFPGSSPSDTHGMAYYDDDTAAAAVVALGRPLATFLHATDDPAVNGYADADFLRDRLHDHLAAIESHVKATYASAVLELLLPLDVNFPSQYGPYGLGGQLNYYLHTDPRLLDPSTAPFDRLKIEGLDFGAGSRDHDKAKWAMRFPIDNGTWPRSSVRYLIPWFNGGCPWPLEFLRAQNEAVPVINFWAFDHLCLLGWPLPLPNNPSDARFL